jgi:hypothetical protein
MASEGVPTNGQVDKISGRLRHHRTKSTNAIIRAATTINSMMISSQIDGSTRRQSPRRKPRPVGCLRERPALTRHCIVTQPPGRRAEKKDEKLRRQRWCFREDLPDAPALRDQPLWLRKSPKHPDRNGLADLKHLRRRCRAVRRNENSSLCYFKKNAE